MMSMADTSGIHVCVILEGHASTCMGGAEYQAHQLAEELTRREGVRVTYLSRTAPTAWSEPYAIRCIGDTTGFRRRAVLFDTPMLWRTLQDLQPDVIYQRMKQSYTAVCAQYAIRAGIPMVFHAASDPDVDGRWLRKQLSMNTPLDLLEVAAGNWGVRSASHVVVQTSRQAGLLKRRFRREPTSIIRNFQPLPTAIPAKNREGFRVLWVGNIKEVKRPELFLALANRMESQSDIKFWMVGREGTHRSIRKTMSAIYGSERVRYFGELPLDEVNGLMNEADVFVNTSSFEGFPNTFIQAWARGTIVTSLEVDVDGGMEANGIGFCAGDVARLAQIIEHLRESRTLREDIARRAFKHVRQEHSLRNLGDLADLVLEVAKAPGRRQPWCRLNDTQQG